MHQKDLAKLTWERAGLYKTNDPKLHTFLQHVNEATGDCWSHLILELREHYPEYKERLAIPLWDTGDKLLRLNIIRAVNLKHNDEVEILRKLVRRSDPQQDVPELRAIVQKEHGPLLDQVVRKKGLDPEFKNQVQLHRARVLAETAASKNS